MKCPHCRRSLRCKVELFLDIPSTLMHRLAKTRLRQASVRVEGANWPKAMLYCPAGHYQKVRS